MRVLSRRYALEQVAEGIRLFHRQTGEVYTTIPGQFSGNGLIFNQMPVDLDGEAKRLLLQWVFDEQSAETLCFPLPVDAPVNPGEFQAWSNFGARMEGANLRLTRADFQAYNRDLGCKGAAWIERELPQIQVACLVLVNERDEILLTQRPQGKSFAGLWEFPGGKLERGESSELALCREIDEELGITIWNSCLSPLTFVSHPYADFHLTMLAYVCYKFEGVPQGCEGQGLKWWPCQDLNPEQMPPANAPIIQAVQDLL